MMVVRQNHHILLMLACLQLTNSLTPSFLARPGHGGLQGPHREVSSLRKTIHDSTMALVAAPGLPPMVELPNLSQLPSLSSKPKEVVANLEKATRRKKMETDAETSSMLAVQFYFETLRVKESHDALLEVHRLDRSCPSGAEVHRKSFVGNDCVICKGDTCELVEHADEVPGPSVKAIVMDLLSELSQGHRALSGFAGQQDEMKKTEIDEVPVEISWHQALSTTMSVLGVRNRMDSTQHEGTHHMDVVANRESNPHLRWGDRKGLVIQLLTPNSLRGDSDTTEYIKLKTAAIEKGGWAVLSVPWHEWSALSTDVERIGFIAIRLATLGLYGNDA